MTDTPSVPKSFQYSCSLTLCGQSIALYFRDRSLRETARELFSSFLIEENGNQDYRVLVRDRSPEDLPDTPRSSLDCVEVEGDTYVIRHCDAVFSLIPPPTGPVKIDVRPHEIGLENAVRLFLAVVLQEHRTFLFHAASLSLEPENDHRKKQEVGVLFPGPSGAGKSTLSGLAGTNRVLTDELSAVTVSPSGESDRLHGTPFFGDLASEGKPNSVSLEGVLFLEGDTGKQSVRSLSAPRALQRLMKLQFTLRQTTDDRNTILRALAVLVEKHPTGVLHFSPEEPFRQIRDRIRSFSGKSRSPRTSS